MRALSSAATWAALGGAILPGAGALIGGLAGGLLGLLSGWSSTSAQVKQDNLKLTREQEMLELQYAEAKGLTELRNTQRTAQAGDYAIQQDILASQTIGSAGRQSTLLGLNAQAQQIAANSSFIGLSLGRESDIGAARAKAALSGFRGGSTGNAERMIAGQYDRNISTTQRQMEISRKAVSSQLADVKLTATQKAESLRWAGQQAVKQAAADNLYSNTQLAYAKKILDKKGDWTQDDLDWLEKNKWWIKLTGAM